MSRKLEASRRRFARRFEPSCVKVAAAIAISVLGASCDDEGGIVPGVGLPPPRTETELIETFLQTYRGRDSRPFETLLHAGFWHHAPDPGGASQAICRDQWLCMHRQMFAPQTIVPPLPAELWLRSVDVAVTHTPFVERPEYYRSATNPDGLDETVCRVTTADAGTSIFFETQGDTDYYASGRAHLVVSEDRTKRAGEVGKYTLYRIEEYRTEESVKSARVESKYWANVLRLYAAGCVVCPPPAAVGAVVDALRAAYADRDPVAFAALLHPDFSFAPTPVPNQPWGREREERAHRRMFRPDALAPGEPPVPVDLRVLSVDIQLAVDPEAAAQGGLARAGAPGDGDDPASVWEIRCSASVLVETQGPTNYQVNSTQHLVLAPAPGAAQALRIRSWYESAGTSAAPSAASPTGVEEISWRTLRRLYSAP